MKSILDLPPRTDGGDAFPHDASFGNKGMSLRDYFAGQAMVGITTRGLESQTSGDTMLAAQVAYCIADAMLEARKR